MTHYFFWKLLWKEFGGCIYAEMGWKREFEGIEKIEKVSERKRIAQVTSKKRGYVSS